MFDSLRRRPLICGSILFLLAFVIRAVLWVRTGPHVVFDQVEVVQTAMCFARHGFLGNPFILPTGPTAHVTPAFPFLIGLMYRYAPDLATGEHWKSMLTIAIASLQFAVFPLLARAARLDVMAGIIAGLIGALVPMLYLECSGDFEAPLVGLTIVTISAVTLSMRSQRALSSLGAGVLWGLTALVSAQLLISGALYGFLIRIARRIPLGRRVYLAAIFTAGLIAGVLPWTIRNWIELGSPVISRDNAGIELYVSNNDDTAVTFEENLQRHVLLNRHPHSNVAEARLVQRYGEVGYNRKKRAEAIAWIKAHPARFLDLSLHRFLAFWFGAGDSLPVMIYWRATLVLGLAGLWLCWRSRSGRLMLFAVLLVIYPLPHYIVQASGRYRYPLNTVLLLFTGVAIVRFAERARPLFFHARHRQHSTL